MCPNYHLFGLEIPTFGTMMLVGMIAAFVLLYFNRRRVPFSEDDLLTMALYAIIGGFLGSKVLYWFVEFDQIIANPRFLLDTLTSGFVFYGALIAGAFAIWLFSRRRKQPMLAYVDLVAPSFILAQGFGRIGCFCAGCCYGSPSNSRLAVVFPAGSSAPAGVPLLPTQLFETAFCFLFAAVLIYIFWHQKRYGLTTGWYFIGYGVWRFIIEFFRSDDRGAVGTLSTSQFIGIFIVLAGIAFLLLAKNGKTPAHIPPEKVAEAQPDQPAEAEVPEDAMDDEDETAQEDTVDETDDFAEEAAVAMDDPDLFIAVDDMVDSPDDAFESTSDPDFDDFPDERSKAVFEDAAVDIEVESK